MKDPLEMVVREYLPWVRALAALELRGSGYSQPKIARALGVTQPSVALYMKRRREYCYGRTASLGVPRKVVESEVERLVSLSMSGDPESALSTLEIASEALGSGSLCGHHRAEAGLPEGCDICLRFFHVGTTAERSTLLRELEEAIGLLESSDSFTALIPGVLTNFVSAMPDARDESDVAGIAGRMAVVRGRAKAASPPEFGASRYTAGIVLSVKKAFKEVGSGLNVRYDSLVGEAAAGLGWRRLDLGRGESGRGDARLSESITKLSSTLPGPPDILVEAGGMGLEPSAYVLGTGPSEVVEKALALSSIYARRKARSK